MEGEYWKDIPEYKSLYQVSNYGRVRDNCKNLVKQNNGHHSYHYYSVYLVKGANKKLHQVHVLVLEAFVGPKPKGKVSRHLNGNNRMNYLYNLAYGTPMQNNDDCFKHGRSSNAKLAFEQKVLLMRMLEAWVPYKRIAKRFKITESAVRYYDKKFKGSEVELYRQFYGDCLK